MGHEVMSSITTTFTGGFIPEIEQLFHKRSTWTSINNVFSGSAGIQRDVVDVGQEPIGSQLNTSVGGGRQCFFPVDTTQHPLQCPRSAGQNGRTYARF